MLPLRTIDFSEHGVHVLEVVVVKKPHTWLSLVLVKWNYRDNSSLYIEEHTHSITSSTVIPA